jgi:hypothetical protein
MTRPPSDPKRILEVGPPPTTPQIPKCCGAVVRITRLVYQSMQRERVDWQTPITAIPVDGDGEARVDCRNDAMGKRAVGGGVAYYALCANCHGIEERNRVARRIATQRGER